MKTKLLCILLMCIALIGCNNINKTKNLEEKELTNEQVFIDEFVNDFIVEIDVEVEKSDIFHIFYLTNNFENYFIGKQAIGVSVIGRKEFQKIKFNLPKDTIPTRLRIDFGSNKEQNIIKLKSIKISYEDRTLTLTDSLFTKYFEHNKFIDLLGDETMKLILDKEGKYDPYIIGKVWLNRKLEKLAN